MPDAQSVSALHTPITTRGSAARGTGVRAVLSRSARTAVSPINPKEAKPAANDGPVGRAAGPSREALINLIRSYVLAHIQRPIEVAELVAVTGVSVSTLRRAVEAEAGAYLVQFITDIKLDQARAWLSTNRESRSVAQIAAALGFVSTNAFARGYRKRFGESATETRRRAVHHAELSIDNVKTKP